MPDLALLTDNRYTATVASPGDWYLQNILTEDQLLKEALAEQGLSSVRVDWADPTVDWSQFRMAVFRTTWDYFDRFAEFQDWLTRAERSTQLCNPASTIRWNVDKHYLADLTRLGVPVVPTVYLEAGDPVSLQDRLRQTGWPEAVIKPCVSGAARLTFRVNSASAPALDVQLRAARQTEAFMLQPFQDEILRTGEDTLMVLGGTFTHAVRKVAKPGDFRVQDDFGGTLQALDPHPDQIALAERVIAACPYPTVYGRVDLVRGPDGEYRVMELELIEPELWLRRHPPAARVLAQALAERLTDD